MQIPITPETLIDAHHHLWRYSPQEYGWIDNSMQTLRQNFLLPAMQEAFASAGVTASIVVQARQSMVETAWLLRLAEDTQILGVVGWADIASNSFANVLDYLTLQPKLRGLRHVVQGESKGFLERTTFNDGIRMLTAKNLAYDILVYAHQLPEVIAFVDRHPRQKFILDHCGKPDIRHDGFGAWRDGFRELGRRENVYCKLSGLVTEADWSRWKPETLQPYLDTALEAFSARRLMAGSDWPVCLLAARYADWFTLLRSHFRSLTSGEQQQIFCRTALTAYGFSTE